MKYKLNFDGTKTKNRTMQEYIEREFLMEELGFDEIVLDALNDAAKEVEDNIKKITRKKKMTKEEKIKENQLQ